MNHLIFGIKYLTNYWFGKSKKPLICGLVVQNNCNLKCRHCRVPERDSAHVSFEEAKNVIDKFWDDGGRCLYLEGGEPFIWKDRKYRMDDIVSYAKNKGYFAVVIYTNGTWPLKTKADTVFVSVDGLKRTHDELRGESFERIIRNIHESDHKSIYVNFTINAHNYHEIEPFLKYFQGIPKVKGTFFYFHTPYYGFDELYLERDQRVDIMLQLIQLKRKYSILNSKAGLYSGIRNDWKKYSELFKVYEGGEYFQCCRVHNEQTLCKDCGYLSYAEVDQTLRLKPGAVINALKYF